jgi:hypothetical protein
VYCCAKKTKSKVSIGAKWCDERLGGVGEQAEIKHATTFQLRHPDFISSIGAGAMGWLVVIKPSHTTEALHSFSHAPQSLVKLVSELVPRLALKGSILRGGLSLRCVIIPFISASLWHQNYRACVMHA